MKRKVLIITYYWPPSGGSGVQRWVKFVKYIRDHEWEPVIYTPQNPELPVKDPTLLKELPEDLTVLKKKILEPYGIYKKLTGSKKIGVGFLKEDKSPSRFEELFRFIRGNFFIPDPRKLWIKPSVRFLTGYLQKHPVEAVVSTGPPHSMHLIARGLREKLNIPWLADFRDPWTNIDFYDELHLTSWADRKHHQLEYEVLTQADRVTVVSPTMKKNMEAISGRSVDLLTNGFDPDDFPNKSPALFDSFTIAHIGSMPHTRNPLNLWRAVKELTDENPEYAAMNIDLVGNVDYSILQTVKSLGLDNIVREPGYMSHNDVVAYQQKCHILLLVLNDTPNAKCLLPGKLFEYMAAGRPILSIGPADSDAARMMERSKQYLQAGFDDTKTIKNFIKNQFEKFKKAKKSVPEADIDPFSRTVLTSKLVNILNQLSS